MPRVRINSYFIYGSACLCNLCNFSFAAHSRVVVFDLQIELFERDFSHLLVCEKVKKLCNKFEELMLLIFDH